MNNQAKANMIILLLVAALVGVLTTTLVTAQEPDETQVSNSVGTTNPTTMLYQGHVKVEDEPYNGTGYFKFAVVNEAGDTSYWSNDGTSDGGGEPSDSVSREVSSGYFTVLLGDTSLSGMSEPLASTVFSGPGRYLRVWFAQSASGSFTQLSLVPITAAPYAMNAETLGGQDSSDFAPSSHNHWGGNWSGSGEGLTLTSTDSIGIYAISEGSSDGWAAGIYGKNLGTSDTGYGVAGYSSAGEGVGGWSDTNNGVAGYSESDAGVYGSSTDGSGGHFTSTNSTGVNGYSANGLGGYFTSTNSTGLVAEGGETGIAGFTYSPSRVRPGVYGENRGTGNGFGVEGYSAEGIGVVGESITGTGLVGTAGYGSAGFMDTTFRDAIVNERAGVYGYSSDGPGGYFTSTHSEGIHALSEDYGGVWGTSNSTWAAGVFGENTNTGVGVAGDSESGIGVIGESGLANANSKHKAGVRGQSSEGDIYAELASSSYLTGMMGNYTDTYGIYVQNFYTPTSEYGVYAKSTGTGIYGWSESGTGVSANTYSGTALAVDTSSGTGIEIESSGGDYIEAETPIFMGWDSEFRVEHGGTVYADGSYNCGLSSGCFNSGSGADVAERISATTSLEPGDVVEIDPDHSGKFRKASTSYSTLVAGVVSTNPGMTLGNDFDADAEDWDDERPLLALVGQVEVKVTAVEHSVSVGDLLTSSDTPGYAMPCEDRQQCVGAIIGKALEPLESGTGTIKVLLALQ
jgi:hypothetical protein